LTDDGALFGADEARPTKPGEVLATFRKTVAQAREDGKLVGEDDALIAGVQVLAEALDTAHRVGGLKGGYLAAQALPAFQKALHALRLPVELSAATPPAPSTADSHTGAPDWLRDAFGSAE
jgi:hypothetical protein